MSRCQGPLLKQVSNRFFMPICEQRPQNRRWHPALMSYNAELAFQVCPGKINIDITSKLLKLESN